MRHATNSDLFYFQDSFFEPPSIMQLHPPRRPVQYGPERHEQSLPTTGDMFEPIPSISSRELPFKWVASIINCSGLPRLERMAIGARIDTGDVALIKKRLADAKLTLAEPLTRRTGRPSRTLCADRQRHARQRFLRLDGETNANFAAILQFFRG
ncbi:hypothetical protein RMR21_008440 [Agrobacterium sp. rho-8.1]|nr:hypothetical protein [Agrobacterium sp. rho-8.1]